MTGSASRRYWWALHSFNPRYVDATGTPLQGQLLMSGKCSLPLGSPAVNTPLRVGTPRLPAPVAGSDAVASAALGTLCGSHVLSRRSQHVLGEAIYPKLPHDS